MSDIDVSGLFHQFEQLHHEHLYESLELLSSFVVSHIDRTYADSALMTAALNWQAFALGALGDNALAAAKYKRMLSILSHEMTLSVNGIKAFETKETYASVTIKAALCFEKNKDDKAAQALLEMVPEDRHTAGITMALARIHGRISASAVAQNYCKATLRKCPYAIEAALQLLHMGSSFDELRTLNIPRWILEIIEVLDMAKWPSTSSVNTRIQSLLDKYPDNFYLLVALAENLLQRAKSADAIATFERIRSLEPANVRSMDSYAILLRQIGHPNKLNKLAHDLLSLNPLRPEPWVAAALFLNIKGQPEKALEYTEKAISICPTHEAAYLLKGNIAFMNNMFEEGLTAYLSIYSLRRSLEIFDGLVFAYLHTGKVKDALVIAREALHKAPRNAKALTLVGRVLTCSPESREKAHKAFKNALTVDPNCQEAVLSLAELYLIENKLNDALQLLNNQVQKYPTEQLHIKLAEILVKTSNFAEALVHYQIALSENPQSVAAKAGIEQIDRIMKGQIHSPEDSDNEEDTSFQ